MVLSSLSLIYHLSLGLFFFTEKIQLIFINRDSLRNVPLWWPAVYWDVSQYKPALTGICGTDKLVLSWRPVSCSNSYCLGVTRCGHSQYLYFTSQTWRNYQGSHDNIGLNYFQFL